MTSATPMPTATLSAQAFLDASPAPEIESRRLAGRKRRSLVLTNEAARHPFRASLPRHVTMPRSITDVPEERGSQEQGSDTPSFWQLTKDDMRGFASVYFATFAAVLVFIL